MPPRAYLNRIATATGDHEVHDFFLGFAGSMLRDPRERAIFERMSGMSGIEHRFSCFEPASDPEGPSVDAGGLFRRGAFPGTGRRMALYAQAAPVLAARAVEALDIGDPASITHLVVASCTGFSAPGIDLELVARFGLPLSVERTVVGFMGCYAAMNALKLARHIVRSEERARVLVVCVELCTLHLSETNELERLLSFCLWGDGAAAALVSADPAGFEMEGFRATIDAPNRHMMSWDIGDAGFDMYLSGQVPGAIHETVQSWSATALGRRSLGEIDLWAVHPGGRSVIDAVQRALALPGEALAPSREVLRANGNMSSATILFVLKALMATATPGQVGCGMAFGPGLTVETMAFRHADG